MDTPMPLPTDINIASRISTSIATGAPARIGLLVGSERPTGNGRGLTIWLCAHLTTLLPPNHTLIQIFPFTDTDATLTLGPLTSAIIPAGVKESDQYDNSVTRQWSHIVTQCDAFVILTPQYNWGYPGPLKTALDHLYHEWSSKPVMVVTYGSRGGGKCGQQLRQVLQGLHMRVVSAEVSIALPESYVRGSSRVAHEPSVGVNEDAESVNDSFLLQYRVPLEAATKQLVALLQNIEASPSDRPSTPVRIAVK